MIRLLFLKLLLSLSAAIAFGEDMPDAMSAVNVSIAIPKHHGHRSVSGSGPFHVLITNASDKPIRLWSDRYSWGYDNLSFESIGEDGKATRIFKKPRGWDKNFPDWLEIAPGESYVLSVDWSSEQGRAIWENAPVADGKMKPTSIKLRALYEVQPDEDSRKLGVWTGKAASATATYAIW